MKLAKVETPFQASWFWGSEQRRLSAGWERYRQVPEEEGEEDGEEGGKGKEGRKEEEEDEDEDGDNDEDKDVVKGEIMVEE